ncbi:hypothetical protein HNP38_002575 [Chryseobacterium defluvii]|uniref:Uncharacterized protein n=1 Tax=Chryseobacterium defluvii TaxID=160396 RepID=A0A840KD00_9FLAO|nr:hypothetical protein [Chryseobacterium defluvii]MBB4807271.1 hypothetical protein [Chryseobacterium defluvii]
MKKTYFILILTVATTYLSGQTNKPEKVFQLFPTQNMWTFLKLNTRNGQIWQVQYSMKDTNRFEIKLNSNSLTTVEGEMDGRFNLYPTQNFNSFLLLDQIDGRVWQVQWSTKPEEMSVVPINKIE